MRHVQCNINPYATRTVQHRSICDTYSAISTHMRHVQCNTAPYATRTVQYQPISDLARTVQHRSICDTYSAISTHMRHVQCNTAPYATRTVQYQPICDTYSAAPLHAYATRTVQYQPICDTYSAAPLHMRHVQCTDTDPCHMRHDSALTPIHTMCNTYICGMLGGELFNDVQNEQATHLVSSSSIHGWVLLRNTSQSSPGPLQIYLYQPRFQTGCSPRTKFIAGALQTTLSRGRTVWNDKVNI